MAEYCMPQAPVAESRSTLVDKVHGGSRTLKGSGFLHSPSLSRSKCRLLLLKSRTQGMFPLSLSPPGTTIDVSSSDEISVINEKYEGTPTVTTSSEGTSTDPSGTSTPQKC